MKLAEKIAELDAERKSWLAVANDQKGHDRRIAALQAQIVNLQKQIEDQNSMFATALAKAEGLRKRIDQLRTASNPDVEKFKAMVAKLAEAGIDYNSLLP